VSNLSEKRAFLPGKREKFALARHMQPRARSLLRLCICCTRAIKMQIDR
jgi:hypothetical protein